MLMNEAIWKYVLEHQNDDVRRLALQGTRDDEVNLQQALQQIAGRQSARRKLPTWAATDGIVYPPHLNMEQCSSEQTARYKASIAQGFLSKGGENSVFVDLTGGFGVDFYWMSQGFSQRFYVERDASLCAIAAHNFQVLDFPCSVCCRTTATHLAEMPRATLVFMDPARRDEHGGRTYGMADCSPNVLQLLPQLMQKTDRLMLKLSPMLDWRKAVSDLQGASADGSPVAFVSEVHIVSVGNECKELLLVVGKEPAERLRLCCVNDNQKFETEQGGGVLGVNSDFSSVKVSPYAEGSLSASFLYEPNASIMKAGCFAELAQRYQVNPVSTNSHLFLSSVEIGDFPGRAFRISSISTMNKKEMKQHLDGLSQANISVRNFPLSADQLRKKLKLKDGGDVYIFATSVQNGEHKLFICRKIS